MMTEWRKSTWGDEISLEYGKALRDYDKSGGKYRVFGSNGPIGWTEKSLVQGPGIILGRKGAYRGVEYWKSSFFVIDTAYYVVPKSKLDLRWLYYAIKHHKLGELDDGSPIPSTTRAAVYVKNLEIPSLEEQRAIANILGSLDDKIELNRRMNETLEGIARALFKSWFVDFDPVRAKMDGRQPHGMTPEIAELFPSEFDHVNGELVPKGWRIRRIGDVAHRVTKGDTPRKEALTAAGENEPVVPMLRVNAITEDGEILNGKFEYIPESIHFGKSKRSILQENDILYTNAGTIGRVALVHRDLLPANTNQAIAIVRPNVQEVPPVFLYMQLRQPEFQAELHCDIVQAVQANLALGKIADAVAIFPPSSTICNLISPVGSVLERIWSNRRESASLMVIRDTLLPKLLSGELRVPNAEKLVEEVL